ncbi:hypothetical protein [Paludisphaera borealis]|uniref:Uncharacterized protein n=1 Tax=Paludisphaera borealis TaxID=1387353 RepID=A0A1U7CRP8_9BACT|nr:hypothetical protein [Paludisphaera borealis]APW61578.1 hypothetical protein BSF38_03096 [Paludisphaera borealis]
MSDDRIAPGKKAVASWDDWGAPPATRRWWLPRRKLSLTEGVVIAAIVWVLFCLMLPTGADYDLAHRYPAPVAGVGNDFAGVAGEYDQGASRGRNWRLSILPDGRYSFVWSGCLGVYHRESGSVIPVTGYLVLSPVKQIEPRIKRIFLPIRWGSRSYLIPPESLQEFCDAIINGDEPRHETEASRFYALGLNVRVDGVPELPEPWAAYLRESAVFGAIVEATEGGRVRGDVGSADGLRIGSVLTVQGRGDRYRSRKLRVVAVDEHSCRAEEGDPGEFKNPLEAGWKVVAAREPQATPSP